MESKKSWIFCEAPGGADEGAAEVEDVGAAVSSDEAGFDSVFVSVLAAKRALVGCCWSFGSTHGRSPGAGDGVRADPPLPSTTPKLFRYSFRFSSKFGSFKYSSKALTKPVGACFKLGTGTLTT